MSLVEDFSISNEPDANPGFQAARCTGATGDCQLACFINALEGSRGRAIGLQRMYVVERDATQIVQGLTD